MTAMQSAHVAKFYYWKYMMHGGDRRNWTKHILQLRYAHDWRA